MAGSEDPTGHDVPAALLRARTASEVKRSAIDWLQQESEKNLGDGDSDDDDYLSEYVSDSATENGSAPPTPDPNDAHAFDEPKKKRKRIKKKVGKLSMKI